MSNNNNSIAQDSLRTAITAHYRMDEASCVHHLIRDASLASDIMAKIETRARKLVMAVRRQRLDKSGINALLHEYDLSNEEGIALMCLAESLLRVPDNATRDQLIHDKLGGVHFEQHAGQSPSMFVNATTWGLMLTGRLFTRDELHPKPLMSALKNVFERLSDPIVRNVVLQAMTLLGKHFVMASDIDAALSRSSTPELKGYRYSYDMLGEVARTQQDADRYFQTYYDAIQPIADHATQTELIERPGISVKLSALHPRFEFAQSERIIPELTERLLRLAKHAQDLNVGLTIDAEEANRLDITLDIFTNVFRQVNWQGLGIVVQAYQKRAIPLLEWLADLAKQHQKRIMVRLVKGAYWDSEIKQAQILGLDGYPVFTRKAATDVSYLACTKKLLKLKKWLFPQFATHNAFAVASVLQLTDKKTEFEFQCLHGMGQSLYDQLVEKHIPCRVYAPVGQYEDLLPYLVRRLLENGANLSFVNQIRDQHIAIKEVIADPIAKIKSFESIPHPNIPLPKEIYEQSRLNSAGIDLSDINQLQMLYKGMNNDLSLVKAVKPGLDKMQLTDEYSIEQRCQWLNKAADLYTENMPQLVNLLINEGHKTIPDAIGEVRETIDACRYYAEQAMNNLSVKTLPGPTGELNQLHSYGRGIALCISPWNFPLAIFSAQVIAALVAGNAVLAKPASLTPNIAAASINILYEAGIPKTCLRLIHLSGSEVSKQLLPDERIRVVMLTGSTETAKTINQVLANRSGPIIPLVAETGGQNTMIADSTALAEELVMDVIQSAFNSAGQRCSALRVLYVQEEIADKVIDMLTGAMQEVIVGDPKLLSTDIGPVIDNKAKQSLLAHIENMQKTAKFIAKTPLTKTLAQNNFVAPHAFEINHIDILTEEVFGPILHIIRYQRKDLDKIINQINSTGYGLTFGIHSRIDETINYIQNKVKTGNIYVNRNMIGAVMGVQPFGGEGLSGTGPKAGGPNYLQRLCTERSISKNTTASGGNTTLLSLKD